MQIEPARQKKVESYAFGLGKQFDEVGPGFEIIFPLAVPERKKLGPPPSKSPGKSFFFLSQDGFQGKKMNSREKTMKRLEWKLCPSF